MLSHGFVAGLLFYLVGAVYQRAHTRELSKFGGLGSLTPRWATAFVFASLASAGLPGLSGFPGEYVTILESFTSFGWWILFAAFGVVLAAAYNLRAVRETVQGPQGSVSEIEDLDRLETYTVALASVAIVALGVAPAVVTLVADPVLSALASAVGGGV
jgi:NADH-quinone oxidoreductase subunit M